MENRKPLGRYLMGAYILLLSLPVFVGGSAALSSHFSGGEMILLGYFVMAVLFVSLSLGLFIGQHWVEPLGRYVYPVAVIPVLGLGSFTFAALSGIHNEMKLIYTILFVFDFLFLIYIFPIILYFHFGAIKRLSLWVKILSITVCVSPIAAFFIFYPHLVMKSDLY